MANFFYTDENGTKQGPLTPEQLQALINQGIITPDTLLESEAGHTGKARQIRGLNFPAVEPSLSTDNSSAEKKSVDVVGITKSLFETLTTAVRNFSTAVPPIQAGSFGEVPSNAADTIRKLNFYFNMMCVCVAAGLSLFFLLVIFLRGIALGISEVLADGFGIIGGLSVLVVVIVGAIFGLMLFYRLWAVIPEDIARTTPTKAVWFLFVPFFVLYWIFVAVIGLGEDLNKALRQRGIQYKVSAIWGVAFCVLITNSSFLYFLDTWVFHLDWLEAVLKDKDNFYGSFGDTSYFNWAVFLDIVGAIVLFGFLNVVKNGAIAFLEQEE